MTETLEEIEKRHSKKLNEFRKNCKHEHVHIFKQNIYLNSGWTRIDDFSAEHFEIGKDKYYDSVMIKCADCGTPLMAYERGKISLYEKADYYSDEAKP